VSTDRSLKLENIPSKENLSSLQDSFDFYQKVDLVMKSQVDYHLDFGQYFTAIKISSLDTQKNAIQLTTDIEDLHIGSTLKDENADIPTSFIVFLKPTNKIKIKATESTTVLVELFFAPTLEADLSIKNKAENFCEKPPTISQTVWRKELPEPKEGRKETLVKHCVIHHSAGNNSDTNYVNIIRNIYLLHTNSNGWDDIGYNYVVAPNGVIFSTEMSSNSIILFRNS